MVRLNKNKARIRNSLPRLTGKPDAIVLAAVVDGEADAGEVGAQKSSHAERHATRQLGEDVDRLELLGVDVGFAGPIDVVVIDGSEGDVVRLAAFEGFLAEEAKLVVLLFVAGEGEQILGQAVFGFVVGEVFAEFVDQVSVGAVGFGDGFAAEVLVLAFVPVAAGELFESSFGVVGLGDDVVVGGLFTQDFAAGLSGDDLDVLLVDVLAAQLFAAVLVGGYAGHDCVGGWRVFGCGCADAERGEEQDWDQAELRHAAPEIIYAGFGLAVPFSFGFRLGLQTAKSSRLRGAGEDIFGLPIREDPWLSESA